MNLPHFEPSLYRHRHRIAVRHYEIDWQGIVHNGNYLLYFEIARVEYFRAAGVGLDERNINGATRIVIVRNELDHFASATFGDELTVHTRLLKVGNSSFTTEAVMMHEASGRMIGRNIAVMVWTDPKTQRSSPVPVDVRRLLDRYEQGSAAIEWPTTEV